MSEERRMILEMLKEDKISIEEAEKLLEGVGEPNNSETAIGSAPLKPASRKFLRVLVMEGDKTQVNLNFPIALAEIGLKLVPKEALKIEGHDIDVDDILKLIQEGNNGELVNIDTIDKDKHVKVRIAIE